MAFRHSSRFLGTGSVASLSLPAFILDKGLLHEGYFFLVVFIEPVQQTNQFGTGAVKRIAIGW